MIWKGHVVREGRRSELRVPAGLTDACVVIVVVSHTFLFAVDLVSPLPKAVPVDDIVLVNQSQDWKNETVSNADVFHRLN